MGEWNCTEFERELQQCLDARRPLSSLGIAERQIRCEHCRGLWEQFLLLEQALGCRPADAGFSEAVVAHVLLDSETARGGRVVPSGAAPARTAKRSPLRRVEVSRRHVAIAAAAVVLLACVVPLVWQPGNRVAGPLTESDQRTAHDARIHQGRVPEDDLQLLLRDAGMAYNGLAREAHTVVADARTFVPAAFPGPSRGIGIPATEPQWVDEWRRDLKPISDDVHQALGFLFEAVAVEDGPSI